MTVHLARKVRERVYKNSFQVGASSQSGAQTDLVVARKTFRANSISVGDVLRVSGIGAWSGGATDTFQMRMLLGGVLLFDTTAYDPSASLGGWKFDSLLTIEAGPPISPDVTCVGTLLVVSAAGDLVEADSRGDRVTTSSGPDLTADQDLIIDISQVGITANFTRDLFLVEHIRSVEARPIAES